MDRSVPSSLRLLGRAPHRENCDICGTYVQSGWYKGRAKYLQVSSGTTLFFNQGKWVIAREGKQDMAVAWAKDQGHLAPVDINRWHVWSGSANEFVADEGLKCIDAPDVTFLSRRSDLRGDYHFIGLSEGYPYYMCGAMLIRYHPEGRKWLVSGTEHKGSNCLAYAEAGEAPHPGYAHLKWHLWNGTTSQWDLDGQSHCLAAPSMIHVLGRHAQACNARICGTYYLVGVREGRPLYLLPGKKAVIRYTAELDRWLIDFEALEEPGILGRLLRWAVNMPPNECSAFAEARGSSHPGHVDLEWHVWENQQKQAVLDPCVRATSAPQRLTVTGRSPEQENGDICGDYFLVGLHKGWPAYQQKGNTMSIRREKARWVMDRDGFRDSLVCVAYAAATVGSQHAGDGGSHRWHVYDSPSATHALDLAIHVSTEPVEPCVKRQRVEGAVTSSQAHFGG